MTFVSLLNFPQPLPIIRSQPLMFCLTTYSIKFPTEDHTSHQLKRRTAVCACEVGKEMHYNE